MYCTFLYFNIKLALQVASGLGQEMAMRLRLDAFHADDAHMRMWIKIASTFRGFFYRKGIKI